MKESKKCSRIQFDVLNLDKKLIEHFFHISFFFA